MYPASEFIPLIRAASNLFRVIWAPVITINCLIQIILSKGGSPLIKHCIKSEASIIEVRHWCARCTVTPMLQAVPDVAADAITRPTPAQYTTIQRTAAATPWPEPVPYRLIWIIYLSPVASHSCQPLLVYWRKLLFNRINLRGFLPPGDLTIFHIPVADWAT